MKSRILAIAAVFALAVCGLTACSAGIEVDHVHTASCGHAYTNGAWITVDHTHRSGCGCHYADGRWCR